MDHRNGQCTRCGASFKIPTTFTAHQARCRDCGGVVRIERAPTARRARPARPQVESTAAPAVARAPAPIPHNVPAQITPPPPPAREVAQRSTPRPTPVPVARRGRALAWTVAAAIVVALSVWMLWQKSSDSVEAAPSASAPPVAPQDARGE